MHNRPNMSPAHQNFRIFEEKNLRVNFGCVVVCNCRLACLSLRKATARRFSTKFCGCVRVHSLRNYKMVFFLKKINLGPVDRIYDLTKIELIMRNIFVKIFLTFLCVNSFAVKTTWGKKLRFR